MHVDSIILVYLYSPTLSYSAIYLSMTHLHLPPTRSWQFLHGVQIMEHIGSSLSLDSCIYSSLSFLFIFLVFLIFILSPPLHANILCDKITSHHFIGSQLQKGSHLLSGSHNIIGPHHLSGLHRYIGSYRIIVHLQILNYYLFNYSILSYMFFKEIRQPYNDIIYCIFMDNFLSTPFPQFYCETVIFNMNATSPIFVNKS